ncbi:YqjK family protein [Rivibacter subsaxonicus]|uniref:YqjK-like protein n=1 Tax=Rivibacter subsaxonicus TaxID=457575 RepID=A0A4Q7W154_9BURK|nr:YqjK family protein [Rivibacter subsaxonicus]RZU02982.1 YqjK-like protein [Rivibacter subsaxonicus]
MRARTEALALRQQNVLARSAALRSRLGEEAAALEPSLVIADRLRLGVAWMRSHQLLLVGTALGVGTLLVMRRPRMVVGLAGTLWSAWNIAKRSLPWLQLARAVYTGAPLPRRGADAAVQATHPHPGDKP